MKVSFLVDSGAAHNFVDPLTVCRLGLKPIVIEGFEVTIVDGEKLVEGTVAKLLR